MPLRPFTTTVVGCYSVPRWFEALRNPEDIQEAQRRSMQAAVMDQEQAGLDIVTSGELHRRVHNRHAPLTSMLNHFWDKLPGFARDVEGDLVLRPRALSARDPRIVHGVAMCTGPVLYADLGLVAEFERVAALARRPEQVKVTVTGPHSLAKFAFDEHYADMRRMMFDLAKVLNQNLRKLAEAGCRHVQLDETALSGLGVTGDEVDAAVDAIHVAFEGVRAYKWVHVCQGNYAMCDNLDGPLGHRYFDTEEYPADRICRIACDALLIEGDMTPRYEGYLRNQQLALGVADVQNLHVESAETLADRIVALAEGWLPREQTLITSSCGMNHLPREVAFGKLQSIARAKQILCGRVNTASRVS
ncbi:MAG: hypothetical protein JNK87_19145 [Bryobacterales bacterium]|nr:hypothetical protein [Bryobacterales bacterium]